MTKYRTRYVCWFFIFLSNALVASHAFCEKKKLVIAVSANFYPAAQRLSQEFERATGVKTILIQGASVKLTHQLVHGLPADLFFSADTRHPQLLVDKKLALAQSLKPYALGELVLVVNVSLDNIAHTNGPPYTLEFVLSKLKPQKKIVALANPNFAPYGLAAREVLSNKKFWPCLKGACVFTQNVTQAYQLYHSANVMAAFVARSNIQSISQNAIVIDIDPKFYAPIKQSLVILSRSSHKELAQKFSAFALSPSGQKIIQSFGYKSP